jgi:hypothetical protein
LLDQEARCDSLEMPHDDPAHCCFCFSVVDRNAEGDGLIVRLTKEGSPALQMLWAHPACIAAALHPQVTFDPEIFSD